ncbi:hypothetical protein [Streptomyces chumphonensis]|uniref:hypothetical protein n=1 Tax=Streptomyces chumphonensis TaxID=1214925 RepID=UPI003D7208FB
MYVRPTAADRRSDEEARRRKTARHIAEFDASLERLSLTDLNASHTRSVVKDRPDDELVVALFSAGGFLAVLYGVAALVDYLRKAGVGPASLTSAALMALGGLLAVGGVEWALWLLRTRTRVGGDNASHRLIHLIVETVIACAEAHRTPERQRASRLRTLDLHHRSVERCLLRSHRSRGSMVFASPRRAVARRHTAAVAGALRTDLCRLDVEPDKALVDLAGKLVRISERYAEGRLGSLLPHEELEGIQPVSSRRRTLWESAHMVLVLLAALIGAAAAATWGSVWGLPESAEHLAMVLGALVGATLTGGWRMASRLKELFIG